MTPLLAFAFEVSPVVAGLLSVLLVGGGLAVGKLLWKDDRKLRQFQRECQDLSQLLAHLGFQLLPPILNDVALLDFAQLSNDFRNAARVLSDPKLRAVEFAKLLKGLVDDQLGDKRTAQVFLDDVVAAAKQLGFTPSASALGGAADDSLLSDSSDAPSPVTVHIHNVPTATEAAAGAAATSATAKV
ncbi:MAG TPA: hypothetical protein VMV69_18085 [Pirellulales bacterium]|nr:hypothetical protein [Pirellulales bacterium]